MPASFAKRAPYSLAMQDRASPDTNERTIAGALNLASIPFPYLGPIVGLIMGHRSPYVRFHAVRSLIEQVILSAITFTLIVVSLVWSLASLAQSGFDLQTIDWKTLILKTVAFWMLLGLFWVANLVNALQDAVDGFAGRYPRKFGWTTRLALKWSRCSAAPNLSTPRSEERLPPDSR